MTSHNAHIIFADTLFDDFLKPLIDKGFPVDINDYVVASQLRDQFKKGDISIDQLKHSLSAIICRNEDEQKQFYHFFDAKIESIIATPEPLPEPLPESKSYPNRDKEIKRIIRNIIIISSSFSLLIISFLFTPIFKSNLYVGEKRPIASLGHITTEDLFNSSILYQPQEGVSNKEKKWDSKQSLYQKWFNPIYDTTNLKVNWNITDTVFRNANTIHYQFKKHGRKKIQIDFLQNGVKKRTFSDTFTVCDPSPKIKLEDFVYINDKTKFIAVNAKNKPVHWKLDSLDIITKDSILEHTFKEKRKHAIRCKTENQYCVHDIKPKTFNVIDKNTFSIANELTGVFKLDSIQNLNTLFYILLVLLSTLFLCSSLVFIVPYLYRKYQKIMENYFERKNLKMSEKYFKDIQIPIFTANEPPVDIDFYNKDRLIKGRENIKKLRLDLQKKIATDDSKLSLSRTIKASIRNYDLITPVFENKNSKRSYLILVDVSYVKSPQIKLFSFLVNYLQKSQVDLDIYYYYKNPIKVFKKEIDDSIDITRLKNSFYQSVLVVFGNGYNFLDDNLPEINENNRKEYSYWPKRTLITPVPSLDWSANENILANFFHIVPADSAGLLSIFQLLQKGIYDQQVFQKEGFDTYESKFVEFENIEELKNKYINNELFFQWLCAIAVYPKISWEIILAIGSAIDENIVTYENLLKISRISWVRDNSFPVRIRLELLKNLDIKNEIRARETIIRLLEEESNINEISYSNNERTIQLIFNKFILFSYDATKFSNYLKEEKEFLLIYQKGKFIDISLKTYLKGIDPDKPNAKWESTLPGSKTSGIDNLEYYYTEKTNTIARQTVSEKIRNYLKKVLISSATLLSLLFILCGFEYFGNLNTNFLVDKKPKTPSTFTIKPEYNDCASAFNPAELIISNGKKVIYRRIFTNFLSANGQREVISGQTKIKKYADPIVLRNAKIFGRSLYFKFISVNNDTISNLFKIDRPNVLIKIQGDSCKRIKAVYFGNNFNLYKDILENPPFQTRNVVTSKQANTVLFSIRVDSSDVYQLCLGLISKKFPLREIMMADRVRENNINNSDEKIMITDSDTNSKIITSEEELNAKFYKNRPKIVIFCVPGHDYPLAQKLKDIIINSKFKYATIKIITQKDIDADFTPIGNGVFYNDVTLNKQAKELTSIARSLFKKNFRLNPSRKDIDKGTLYIIFINKLSVKIHNAIDKEKITKYLSEGDEFEQLLNLITNEKETASEHYVNYLYYKNKADGVLCAYIAEDLVPDEAKLRNFSYNPDIKYDVELGYDIKYDNCLVLTADNIEDEKYRCPNPCKPFNTDDLRQFTVYFDNDKSDVGNDLAVDLAKVLDILLQSPNLTITISTYSKQGSGTISKNLSEIRGEAVRNWFIKNGIQSNRITAAAKGSQGYSNQICFDRSEVKIKSNPITPVTTRNIPNSNNQPLRTLQTDKQQNVKDDQSEGYLYYGTFNGKVWTERNFINLRGDILMPKEGDMIMSTGTVTIRKGEIKFVNGNWVNEEALGTLYPKTSVKVKRVLTVAGGNYVWIVYDLPNQKRD